MARTRAADFEEKQRVILDHAAQVFADQGMEKASMSQIATVAQVSKALLYHYYPSKDALIFAIIMGHLEELDAAIEAADDPALPPENTGARTTSTRCSSMPPLPCRTRRRPRSPRWSAASCAASRSCSNRSTPA